MLLGEMACGLVLFVKTSLLFLDRSRRHTGELLEGADKVRAVVKAGGGAGVFDADAVVQQFLCLGNAALRYQH